MQKNKYGFNLSQEGIPHSDKDPMFIPDSIQQHPGRGQWSSSPRRVHAKGLRYWVARIRALRVLAMALLDGPRLFDRLPTTAWYGEMIGQLIQALGPLSSDHLLDLGCGTGRQAIIASPFVRRVTAADRSMAMLEVAERNRIRSSVINIEIRQEDGEDLSFKNDSFDLATGFMLLPVFKDPTRVLRELLRVVRPGGRIGLLVPSEPLTPVSAWEFVKTRGLRGFDQDSLLAWAHTSRRFSQSDLLRLLSEYADGGVRIIPFLDGMAFAAILTKPGRCVGM